MILDDAQDDTTDSLGASDEDVTAAALQGSFAVNNTHDDTTDSQGASNEDTTVEESLDRNPTVMSYGIQASLPYIPLKRTCVTLDAFSCDFVTSTEKATLVASHPSTAPTKVGKFMRRKAVQTSQGRCLPFATFSDNQFKSFSGVNHQFLQFLLNRVGSRIQEGRKICHKNKLLLMLVKLKLDVSFPVLGGFFGISESAAAKTFYDVLNITYDVVKCDIFWLDRATVQARMPQSFKALFPNTRAIIDCTEIPSDPSARVLTYSSYKSRHTLKVLVSIVPSGEITFISKAYGGRATDTEIVVSSGFLQHIEEGDEIMSDKGFPSIETDINQLGGILVMPPFKTGSCQFTAKENEDCYKIASGRIHVERCIERLKRFAVLTFVTENMRKNIDKILVIIAFIHNCYNDLIKDDDNDDDE